MLIKERGAHAVPILKNGVIIPLVYYEVGNALRTSVQVHHDATAEEAENTLERIFLGLSQARVIDQCDEESSRIILRNALKLKISFYDAAYLTAASTLEHPLVTEDRPLRDAARKLGVEVMTISNLA